MDLHEVLESTKHIPMGFGLGPSWPHVRRKGHQKPWAVKHKNIIDICNITHSPRGITIFCLVEGLSHPVKLEHFDIWLTSNATKKLTEYFAQKSEDSRRRLSVGRLRTLIGVLLSKQGGETATLKKHGKRYHIRPLPFFGLKREKSKGSTYETLSSRLTVLQVEDEPEGAPVKRMWSDSPGAVGDGVAMAPHTESA